MDNVPENIDDTLKDMIINSERTLCFLIKDEGILLSKKLMRLGAGKYNGYGGGIEAGENARYAAIRELKEESGFDAKESDLKKCAVIDFYFPFEQHNNQRVHIYFLYKWSGEFNSLEGVMAPPELFTFANIPYDKMWSADKEWLPYLIEGHKIQGKFVWTKDRKVAEREILILE